MHTRAREACTVPPEHVSMVAGMKKEDDERCTRSSDTGTEAAVLRALRLLRPHGGPPSGVELRGPVGSIAKLPEKNQLLACLALTSGANPIHSVTCWRY